MTASDAHHALKRQAAAIEEYSRKEEGTLAAYWRGYAAGLVAGGQSVRQSVDYGELVATVKKTPKTESAKANGKS